VESANELTPGENKVGSVKDLEVITRPSDERPGVGRFNFSDRYSVFDWGEMPDLIQKKGMALCIISAYFFEELNKRGVPNHYRGLFDESGSVVSLQELSKPSHSMAVNLYRVFNPPEAGGRYNYSDYNGTICNYLIPLEVIYRNSLPEGSSVFKRLKDGDIKPEDLGLSGIPEPGLKLDSPIIDVSTKLEVTDRYIRWDEAQKISGLLPDEIKRLKETTLTIDNLINEIVGRIGLVNEDGKIEFALNEKKEIVVIDVLGTPDECRFTYNGLHVSKELARNFYRGTRWHRETEYAKKTDRQSWKSLVQSVPPHLPERLSMLFSFMYQAVCNDLTEKKWFEVPSLSEVMKEIEKELDFVK
jgi:phosphoribosylaminoimidazole-succinocarboxamide synthase